MPLSESCTRQHPAVPTWQVQVTSHIAARANRNPTYATYATPLKCSVSVNTQYGYAVCQFAATKSLPNQSLPNHRAAASQNCTSTQTAPHHKPQVMMLVNPVKTLRPT